MDSKTIMLVEDNPDDEELIQLALRDAQILNHVVVTRDGEEALDYLFGTGRHAGRDAALMPQLILLDLKLPKLGGLEVLQRIRSDARTALTPVVILTSSVQDEDVVAGYEGGANSYLRKPIDFAKFAGAVKNLGLYWLVLNVSPPVRR